MRSRSVLWPLLGLLVAATFVFTTWQVSAARAGRPVEQAATPTRAATRAAATATPAPTQEAAEENDVAPSLADLEEYNGIPVGFTAEGLPFMGDPNAPVTMNEYSDYLCPFCGRNFNETWPTLLDEYVLTGKMKLVFHDFPIASLHPTAPTGHAAAWCVADQGGAAAYWGMHDQLFARQSEWNQLADPEPFLASVAQELGMDMDAYTECVTSGVNMARVDDGVSIATEMGFNATPSFLFTAETLPDTYRFIGAYPVDSFRQFIDTMLAGEAPPQEPAEPEPQLPPWASPEGLTPNPDMPGYTMAGDQYKGNPDALVTVIEFSDFQCPACAQHNNEVQAVLDKEFIESDKVFWVFKNRPLPMHPYAPVGAAAGECAADQGMFWEMHDAIFADMETWAPSDAEEWSVDDAETGLLEIAEGVGLDSGDFEACLDSREPLERVIYDLYDAEGVVSSTPSFIVLYGGQGTILNGSRPAEEFVTVLNTLLEQAQEEAE